jgi:hypothetical protein
LLVEKGYGMKKLIIALTLLVCFDLFAANDVSIKQLTKANHFQDGFIGQIYDKNNNKLYLKITNLESEFIYQSSLPQGLGSNDIGLDRGQLGAVRLVEFNRVGNKVLLQQKNTKYRAVSDNKKESQSVAEAFASAVLWSFAIVENHKDWVLVDASDFILQDIHGVSRKLAKLKQGNYKLEKSRSAIFLPRSKSFPDNTELEATVTFLGNNPGQYVSQATIEPNVISLRMHHSFIRLPKPGYKPRKFHPQSGMWVFNFQDYAQPINQPITQRFIARHRLEKKNPNAAVSEAVEPIIYYLDPGAPEPVKSALIKGAMWWDQAFQAIGYKNAFQVKMLPEDADPLDVRYNVIQWVHRATRGWSYGFGVTDPRTGEIIKGHVTLGSLRVRQDYLIAQGMLSRFESAKPEDDSELMNLALARIRQLSAHEVGHTLGIAHNFAASSFNRASVMDYPHPYFELDADKQSIHARNAYAEGIGVWDKAVIEYGYQRFNHDQEANQLKAVIKRNQQQSMLFISDPDSRRIGDAQPYASLWDNGANAVEELKRMIQVRKVALDNFGKASLHKGRPYSDLQEILMPVYYSHRYQATAAAKWLGGVEYSYSLKQDSAIPVFSHADAKQQQQALQVLVKTMQPEFLSLDQSILSVVAPRAYGYWQSRETPQGNTGKLFDPNALAAAAVQHTLSVILEPTRLARLELQHQSNSDIPNIAEITELFHQALINIKPKAADWGYRSQVIDLIYSNYLNLLHAEGVPLQVKSPILGELLKQRDYLQRMTKKYSSKSQYHGFYRLQLARLQNLSAKQLKRSELIKLPKLPPGSPI